MPALCSVTRPLQCHRNISPPLCWGWPVTCPPVVAQGTQRGDTCYTPTALKCRGLRASRRKLYTLKSPPRGEKGSTGLSGLFMKSVIGSRLFMLAATNAVRAALCQLKSPAFHTTQAYYWVPPHPGVQNCMSRWGEGGNLSRERFWNL